MNTWIRLAAALVLSAAAEVCAQNLTATLVGRVLDPSGALVVGAKVEITDSATNEIRKVQSDPKGEFIVPDLRPGTYEVSVSKEGFRTLRQTGLELQLEQQARMEFHLEVGSLAQTIEVTASVPLVNTENGVKGDVVVSQEMLEMPLDGRNFSDLAFLTPGVLPESTDASNRGGPFAISGARADNTNFVVDGFNNNNFNGGGYIVQPNLDAMEEFKIQTSGYSAETGRLAGGVINVVLKSGGNQFHGTLFEFVRNDLLDTRNFFNTTKSELRRNQFGASLSGPVRIPKLYNGRDRTFFLFSWESQRQRQGSPRLQVVPTLAVRQGDFSAYAPIKDPMASGTCSATNATACFPNNQIPLSRISPIALKAQEYYPLPNNPGVNNYYADPKTLSDFNSYIIKIDQRITPVNTLSFRYTTRGSNSMSASSGYVATFLNLSYSPSELAGLTYLHNFSPGLINEARFGLTRSTGYNKGGHQGTDYSALLGIPWGPTDPRLDGFPVFEISNYAYLGDEESQGAFTFITNYNAADTLTWVKGRHLIKAGGGILFTQLNGDQLQDIRGVYKFTGSWTGQPYADVLLGLLNSDSRLNTPTIQYIRVPNYSLFFQDDWKITPRLTLNLGLRYELPMPMYEKYGRWSNFVPELGKLVIASDATLAPGVGFTDSKDVVTAKQVGLPSSLVYPDFKDLSPRFGIAWRPFGGNRTSVRGGYGIFYGGTYLSDLRNGLANVFPWSNPQTINRNAANPEYLTLSNPFPVGPTLTGNAATTSQRGLQLHQPTPYLQSWSLTLEREIGLQSAIEIGYIGSKGTHLDRGINLNQPFRSAATYPNFPVPYPAWGTLAYYAFGFNSNYNAGSVTLRRRFARGFFYRGSYTYSKSIDNASELGTNSSTIATGISGMEDPRNWKLERGRSDWDIRQSFTMSFSWAAPPVHNVLLRGWQLAGTGTARSGPPFTPMLSTANQNLGESIRPNRIATGTVPNPNPSRWFDVSAFPVVPDNSYAFGNSGRDILDAPGAIQINLALDRNFTVREQNKIQFRWEVFNALNHANFALPAYYVNAPNCATLTSAGNPRTMQLALRYSF